MNQLTFPNMGSQPILFPSRSSLIPTFSKTQHLLILSRPNHLFFTTSFLDFLSPGDFFNLTDSA